MKIENDNKERITYSAEEMEREMYKVLNKKRKIILLVCCICTIILLGIWGNRVYSVNKNAFHQKVIHYSIGERVELENNFFFSGDENTDGYSIKVNSAKLENYPKFLASYGEKVQTVDGGVVPKYVCLLDVTIKNSGNESGYLNTVAFALFNGALQIPIDFELWNIIDKNIDGNTTLKLKKDSEVNITLPFVAQALDETMDSKKLNKRLENEEFNFFVCDFPVRKLIDIKFSY